MSRAFAVFCALLLAVTFCFGQKGEFDQEECLKALESESYYRREVAAQALAAHGDLKVVKPLIEHMLNDPVVSVRKMCLNSLVMRKEKSAIPYIIQGLKDKDVVFRQRACHALGEMRTEEGYKALVGALKDSSEEVRAGAVEALANFGTDSVFPEFAKLFEDKSLIVRRVAVRKIAEIGGEKAVEHLIGALNNSDFTVISTAIKGLDKLKARKAVPHIIPILDHENASLRATAAGMLGRMPGPKSLNALFLRLERDESGAVRKALIEAFSIMAFAEAERRRVVKTLAAPPGSTVDDLQGKVIKFLDDSDAEIRELALDALIKANVKTDLFKGKLRYISEHDPVTSLRVKAKSALLELGKVSHSYAISATLEPVKAETVVGEPVILKFKARNNTDKELEIDLGTYRLGAYRFKIFDATGTLLAEPPQYEARELRHVFDQFGASGITRIKPGEVYEYSVVLDRWYQPREEGFYRIRCEFGPRAVWGKYPRNRRAAPSVIEKTLYSLIPTCELSFRKLPYDRDVVENLCKEYFSQATGSSIPKANWSTESLMFCDEQIARPYLFRVLQEATHQPRLKLLRHLVETRALKSADELVKFHNDNRMTDWARKEAVRILRMLSLDGEIEPGLAANALKALKRLGDEWALKQPETEEPVVAVVEPPVKKSDTAAPARPEAMREKPTKQTGISWLLLVVSVGAAVVLGCAVLAAILYRSRKSQSKPG